MSLLVTILLLALPAAFGEDICQTCSCKTKANAQILTLNCVNKNLDHILSKWPSQNNTIIANFAGNNLPTLEPLPPTNASVEIILSRCNIKYLKPALFAASPDVKFVDLSYNKLPAEQIASEKFRGPINNTEYRPIAIENLNLAYNQIHSLGMKVFEHMPNLKILNLEGNDFTMLDLHTQLALSSIRQLQSLNLANNELTEMIAGAIETHKNLTDLNLSNNLLDFVPFSLAKVGNSLQILNLDNNPIMELTSESFLGLGNIIELSANNLTKLKYVNANTFDSMPKVKKLSLSNNFHLRDIDREAFAANQTLEEFYLNNNELFRLDFNLLPWSKLHIFEFKNNPFDCSCDLYNITLALSKDIIRSENGPYCMDPRTEREIQVFYLKSDICSVKSKHVVRTESIEYQFSIVRISLIVLSVILMLVALVAAVLGVIKYRRYQRNMSYPYATQIAYDPVSTNAPRF
ncbi:leucine-rich repeat-containing protein 70-like [Tribolium madens]|uniref:leucine-rich repeat-containing protein 70-like n=1 Tax=Tribolium madens TaxID=41895 RepID=UPI001CF738C2|nr:leucine-rich repeat-containing protein 70-like [Tribolium madens]